MTLAIIAGCAAFGGIVITRKDGPWGTLKWVRTLGYTFRCSLCTAALVAVVVAIPLHIWPIATAILSVPAAAGYALAIMALTGVIDLE